MNVGELKKLLAGLPDDMEIYYRDGNYGGTADQFVAADIEVHHTSGYASPIARERVEPADVLLINSPYWTDCEQE